ncbi:hypothetical protein ACTA71_006475 [Dictyostelium dimigraforme]
MKIYLIIPIVIVFLNYLLVYGYEFPMILSGGTISLITIGKQQFVIKSRGISAIYFNPDDLTTFRVMVADTSHSFDDLNISPSHFFYQWLKIIEKQSPGWMVAMVSTDDTSLTMSNNLKSFLSNFDVQVGFKTPWLLALKTNGRNYSKINSSFLLQPDKNVHMEWTQHN